MNAERITMNAEPEQAGDERNETAPETPADETTAAGPGSGAGLEDQIEALRAKVDENWDRYVRAAAELENVRKRASRDVENAHKFALERFATDLLAVCDSLEMALQTDQEASIESLREGSEATLKLLNSILQRFGVEQVDPEGEPFDPNLHEAMTMQPSATAEPGSVLTVFQKGYALNGRLLRPARVVVAAEPGENS
jgi:molecular chaperone GrpE